MDSVIPYVTLEEAQAYFDDARLNAESWDNSTPENQIKALKSGTIAIDRLSFKGIKVVSTQPNEFPRLIYKRRFETVVEVTNPVVPDDIKIACCEVALALLDGVDPDLEEDDLSTVLGTYATVRVTSDPAIRKDHIRSGIPSVTAWKHLLPYLNDPNDLHLRKG